MIVFPLKNNKTLFGNLSSFLFSGKNKASKKGIVARSKD